MNTFKRLANKLVLCALGAAEESRDSQCVGGSGHSNSHLNNHHSNHDGNHHSSHCRHNRSGNKDQQFGVIQNYLAERAGDKLSELVQYYDYRGPDMDLAVVRAIIAAVHVKAAGEPAFSLLFLTTMEKHELSPWEKDALNREFKHPAPVQGIVRLVQTSQIAALVYTLSLLTLDPDDLCAANYLRELAAALDLGAAPV